jgi:uncharacterized protein (TIGR03118 family)
LLNTNPKRILLSSFAALALAAPSFADPFTQVNLTSDIPGMAQHTDPNLKNPWGMSFGPNTPFWVSNQVTGNSTLYGTTGAPAPLVVTTPPGGPTGQVFNGTSDFAQPGGGVSRFIFATLAGTIDGWTPTNGTTAMTLASTPGAVYTGLAIGSNGAGNFLYAANAAGGIDVFDSAFNHATLSGAFTDPNLPAGYTPYNIQNINGSLFVEYSQGTAVGAGLGAVNEFDTNGNFVRRLVTGGALNAPWGITMAPTGFGQFGGDLLIGNLGDGKINAFDPTNGSFQGVLTDSNGNPIVNDGLWALAFRTDAGYNPNSLYFTAGINGETNGLFGTITPTPEPATILVGGLGLAVVFILRRRRSAHSNV